MRVTIPLAMLLACSKTPAPPDPKQFAAMSEDQQCEATAPRGESCADEILGAQLHSMARADPAMKELEKTVQQDLDHTPTSSRDARSAMHRTMCDGEPHYREAILACWSIDECKPFARCVMTKADELSKKK